MAMAAAASSERVLRSAAPATSATVPFDTMYINLDRRTDRRKSMESRLAAAGLSQWERVPARTGKETPPSRVCTEWDARLNHQFDTNCAARVYRFSDGERGCAMSHVLLWERVAARENEGRPVLVLEDDAVLDGRNSVAIISSLVALIERSAMPSQRVRTPYTHESITHESVQRYIQRYTQRYSYESDRFVPHSRSISYMCVRSHLDGTPLLSPSLFVH